MSSSMVHTPPRAAGTAPAVAALILGAVAMGLSPVAVRLADVGPFASAFWRVALALPVLGLWMRLAEGQGAPAMAGAGHWSGPTLLAGLVFSGDLFFWHLALVRTSVANATFFATCAPLWVVVFGWLLFRERVGRATLGGLALCCCGGAALVWQSLRFAPNHLGGDGFGIVTGVFFGLYFLAIRAARARGAGAARVTFEMSLVAAAILLIVALALENTILPRSASGWVALGSLSLVSHAGGQGLLSFALGLLPAVFSSLVIFLEAIAAAVAAFVVLGEPISALQASGGLLIVLGIWVARPRRAAPGGEP